MKTFTCAFFEGLKLTFFSYVAIRLLSAIDIAKGCNLYLPHIPVEIFVGVEVDESAGILLAKKFKVISSPICSLLWFLLSWGQAKLGASMSGFSLNTDLWLKARTAQDSAVVTKAWAKIVPESSLKPFDKFSLEQHLNTYGPKLVYTQLEKAQRSENKEKVVEPMTKMNLAILAGIATLFPLFELKLKAAPRALLALGGLAALGAVFKFGYDLIASSEQQRTDVTGKGYQLLD